MEPFVCPSTRKKLPGKHGQQDLIAAPRHPGKTSKPFQNKRFPTWHGFRSVTCRTAGLGEPFRFGKADPRNEPGRATRADHWRGEPPMENTLLIGLSRQMILDRQMDVVANNAANANPSAYKAHR